MKILSLLKDTVTRGEATVKHLYNMTKQYRRPGSAAENAPDNPTPSDQVSTYDWWEVPTGSRRWD